MRRIIVTLAVTGLAVAFGASPGLAGEGNLKKFCNANLAIDRAFAAQNESKLNRALDTAENNAPPDVADAVDVAVPALREDPETAFDQPGVEEAIGQIEQYVYDECGYEQVDVTMEDYAFTGLSDEIDSGPVSFALVNEGAEAHEMVIFRLKGDTTLDDLLAVENEEEFEDMVVEVDGGFALPGATGYTTTELKKAGDYAVFCFVPVGATDEAAAQAADEAGAPAHFEEGMVAEFEVVK